MTRERTDEELRAFYTECDAQTALDFELARQGFDTQDGRDVMLKIPLGALLDLIDRAAPNLSMYQFERIMVAVATAVENER